MQIRRGKIKAFIYCCKGHTNCKTNASPCCPRKKKVAATFALLTVAVLLMNTAT